MAVEETKLVKRGFPAVVAGAALVIAGLSGCSTEDTITGTVTTASADQTTATSAAPDKTTTRSAVPTTSATTSEPPAAENQVFIDGQLQVVGGTAVCSRVGERVNIAIGGAAVGIAAVVGAGDPPTVHSVALGNINGVTLGYTEGVGQGDARAEKDGNTYRITGTATGIDIANPLTVVNKPFEMIVTCR